MDNYYPFGLTFNSYSRENGLEQNYLYNGKELQDELDLGWLDYGARMYMPEIGRWGTIDPLAGKFEIVTPYNYAFNNPIFFVDPDGRENVIYLIVAGKFDRARAGEIMKFANAMFEKLGLETRIQLFDEKANGSFTEKGLDPTDNWAVIGDDRKAIAEKAKSITSDEDFHDTLSQWEKKSGGYPEESNKRKNGIVVDYSDNLTQDWDQANRDQEAGIAIMHGAGHGSDLIQDTKNLFGDGNYGHLDQGIMQSANGVARHIREHGVDYIFETNQSKVLKGNETYVQAMMQRYGTKKSTNNYKSNVAKKKK